MTCSMCGGPLMLLGNLGNEKHLKCRDCGVEFIRRTRKFASFNKRHAPPQIHTARQKTQEWRENWSDRAASRRAMNTTPGKPTMGG